MLRRLAAPAVLLLALTACGGESDVEGQTVTTPPPVTASPSPEQGGAAATPPIEEDDAQRIQLTYAGGQVTGDTGRVSVPLGTTVRLTVVSDVTEELHVHGYDEYADLAADSATEVEFVADLPGIYEVELHGSGTVLTRLQVQ